MKEIECLPLPEYFLRLEAYQLQQVKRTEDIAWQAWLNQQVQATKGKKNPKPVYTSFTKFYDRMLAEDNVRKAYEPDYHVSKATSERSQKERAYDTFNKNIEMYRKLKASGKLDELRKRKRGGS